MIIAWQFLNVASALVSSVMQCTGRNRKISKKKNQNSDRTVTCLLAIRRTLPPEQYHSRSNERYIPQMLGHSMFGKNIARILPRNSLEKDSNLLKVTQEFRLTKEVVGGGDYVSPD